MAVSVVEVEYGQLGPSQRQQPPSASRMKKGLRRSAVVGPYGAANPCGSSSCAHAFSVPGLAMPNAHGTNPICSLVETSFRCGSRSARALW
ncbi:hypothetical protein [Nonomuraea sp. NPDC003709]|uniref:hypothetical protein n=1 Tax=Nonomuraea sp. NPDC003709 TaxID=3154450 RepID=UPI0033BF1D24